MDSNVSAGALPTPSIGLFNHFFITPLEGTPAPAKKLAAPTRTGQHTFIYLTEGAAKVTIGERQYIAQEEEMLVVAAGQIWANNDDGPEKFSRGFLLRFEESWLAGSFGPGAQAQLDQYEFLDVIGNPRIRFNRMDARCVEGDLERMHSIYTSRWVQYDQFFIHQLVATQLACMERHYRPLFFRAPEKGRELTRRFRLLLHQHRLSKQRVADYAVTLGVTPNHLNKVVKETTFRSPTRWIDDAIIGEAKLLLTGTALPVAEVAAKMGMEDVSYFIRMFRKYVGMTPGGYRAFWEGKQK